MENQNNRGSLIVVGITILLILGAVFLLNRSFNPNRNEEDDELVLSSSSSSFSQSSSSSSSSSENFLFDPTESEPVENDGDDTILGSSSSSTSSSSSKSSSKSSSQREIELENGQAVIQVESIDSQNRFVIKTVQSEGLNSKYFQPDSTTALTLTGSNLKVGEKYKVALKVTDTESGFSLSGFQILETLE